jgi:hypothetical protein
MRHIILIFFFILPILYCKAQNKLIRPVEIETPYKLVNIHHDSITNTYLVDFNGDKKDDYISIKRNLSNTEPYATEYWYNSDFCLYRKVDLYNMDYDIKYFINLDNDSIPEILRAQGYSDGIDYFFTKQNTKNKDESVLFYFIPIIKAVNHDTLAYYWGYPWTLDSILLFSNKNETKLSCSLNHSITRDGEVYQPKNQLIFPAIIFSGEPKSGFEYTEEIGQVECLTIDTIIKMIKQ